jgi:hypothetical protein
MHRISQKECKRRKRKSTNTRTVKNLQKEYNKCSLSVCNEPITSVQSKTCKFNQDQAP